jgi:hypothetical protein
MSTFKPLYYCPYGNVVLHLYWNQKYCNCNICLECCSEKEDRNLYTVCYPSYQIFKTQEEWDRRDPLYGRDETESDTPHGINDCKGSHLETINVDGKIKCIHCAIDINDDAHETINPDYDLRKRNNG